MVSFLGFYNGSMRVFEFGNCFVSHYEVLYWFVRFNDFSMLGLWV